MSHVTNLAENSKTQNSQQLAGATVISDPGSLHTKIPSLERPVETVPKLWIDPGDLQMCLSAWCEPDLFEEIPAPPGGGRFFFVQEFIFFEALCNVFAAVGATMLCGQLVAEGSWSCAQAQRLPSPRGASLSSVILHHLCHVQYMPLGRIASSVRAVAVQVAGPHLGMGVDPMLGGKPASPNAPDIPKIALESPTPFSLGIVFQHFKMKQFWINQV